MNKNIIKRRTVPVAIAEDFILESSFYKSKISSGMSRKDAIDESLKVLGVDTSDVTRNVGIIRTFKNKRLGYQGGVFIANTTDDCKFKALYEDISCLCPDYVPEGKTPIDIEELGEDECLDDLTDEEIEEREVFNKSLDKGKVRGFYKNSKVAIIG